ncbi:DNA gyrase subunit A [Hydrogenoanaerobacterium saccharovorans]|uniref:DNA gyrase subunit A n=1 Tax=Hydrogenoanaerobacterium saccharovorans TaxID=474960 RepID=A0A1H8ATR0_9FIRM|nr:DNA topoisomerase (ATP-hydrolyzing) subunit A [Hydrogenoanaerobacterium saccharovorans]RPF47794.1 DNA gyrase subunit A [Hydrogenoanaerobacterium saccharovorans]SEM73198.1 DNA gyrase subunit A [Hydrogenoanaerobacterium saccharovorans]
MPPKKKKSENKKPQTGGNIYIENAGVVLDQPITETIEKNYMPYAMSVIVSRAIPEIDGFKPSHRKLLYTMHKMGLISGSRTKSANIVGQTMHLNPHGDAAIYETMVRLSKGYEALLHPYVDSKGNFGKSYSRDMAYAASRYTEAKLDPICTEMFSDIDKDTVDFVDNYDNSCKEPTLLPVTFPTILVNPNMGIAVGMASSICSFNLNEICETTIALSKNPNHNISQTLSAPDFSGGGYIIYDEKELNKIYETGRGSVRVRSRYSYDKSNNCIDITEIPPSTTIEAIIDKIVDLVKSSKIKEISDIRDETDLSGLKITIDLKRGVDAEKLMAKLFRMTPLEDTFSCNFNVLIAGSPRVMGVRELLNEWIAFREECIKRRVYYDLKKRKEKLHLLQGLAKILLDIDKAIRIVRETEEETEVVPNLMIGFGIDEEQAEYVAEIKLRHLNREYILKRTDEIDKLKKEIADMEDILANEKRVKAIIVSELKDISKKYGNPRKSLIIYNDDKVAELMEEEEIPDYPVNLFFTAEGYFKKITPQSLRMSNEQKMKEGDEVVQVQEDTNTAELLFFSDRCQVYKSRASDFEDTKASVLGDFIPAKLGMDEEERAVYMAVTHNYEGYMLFFFENGKVAKVDMASYQTVTKRKKLVAAYSDKSPLVAAYYIAEDAEFLLTSTQNRMLLLHTGAITSKPTKSVQGVAVMKLKKSAKVFSVKPYAADSLANEHRYRTKTLPAAGMLPRAEDMGEQLTL